MMIYIFSDCNEGPSIKLMSSYKVKFIEGSQKIKINNSIKFKLLYNKNYSLDKKINQVTSHIQFKKLKFKRIEIAQLTISNKI